MYGAERSGITRLQCPVGLTDGQNRDVVTVFIRLTSMDRTTCTVGTRQQM